jgi:hypothetical protein
LLAILCGIFTMSPGLGVVAAILAIPAALRTSVVALRRTDSGAPMSAVGKVAVFLLTIVMFAVVIVASVAAFFFTCLATSGSGSSTLGVGLILGGVAGIAVAIVLIGFFWMMSRSNRNG